MTGRRAPPCATRPPSTSSARWTTRRSCGTTASTPRCTPIRASSRTRWSGSSIAAGSSSGHDSEIPRPGDFVTRSIGTQPVIMVRGKDGGVAVLVNRCMHRGTMVCAAERGRARTFSCPYHGWTYDLGGELLGVPYPGGYAALDKSTRGLTRVPARRELSRLRLREPHADGHLPGGAPRRRHAADRPLLRPLAGGRDRAHRRLGEASLRRQLEDAARERQRRLSPGLRARRAVQDRPHPVPARGRRRARHQGGRARLGRRAHRDRLVSGL